jgi:hypothetical protein
LNRKGSTVIHFAGFAGRGMLPRPKRFTLSTNPDIAKTLGTGLQAPSSLGAGKTPSSLSGTQRWFVHFAGRGMLPRPKRFTLFTNPNIAKTLGTGLQAPSRLGELLP